MKTVRILDGEKEDLRSLRQEGFSLGVSLVISYQRHLMDFDNRLDKSFGWLLWLAWLGAKNLKW